MNIMDLKGEWNLLLKDKPGEVTASCQLPGTLDENSIGFINAEKTETHLHRKYIYNGAAIFSRRIKIPTEWTGKVILLLLERTRECEVWFDGTCCGTQNSVTCQHVYELTDSAVAGEHDIVIKVDNSRGVMSWESIRFSHIAVEETQTNWNGILGKIQLEAKDKVIVKDVQVFTDLNSRSIEANIKINKKDNNSINGLLCIKVLDINYETSNEIEDIKYNFTMEPDEYDKTLKVVFSINSHYKLWDEFSPNIYNMVIELNATSGPSDFHDISNVKFGIREFKVSQTQFAINGKTIFLRGKHDACVFPLTGYAPMDIDEWIKCFKIAKSYGINHYRFHSWCPPGAAFDAADLVGIYLQPELPYWNFKDAFVDDEQWDYFKSETIRILDNYGNHPSFVMFSWGNELNGSIERMYELINICRRYDRRHLYTIGSNNFFSNPCEPKGADYWTTFWTDGKWNFKKCGYGGKHLRGSTPHITRGHINNDPPSTMKNYLEPIEGIKLPVISHEVGQYQIFPDFSEIEKYTGVLEPVNLEAFRNIMTENKKIMKASTYKNASGKLATICYREEIEAALRTPGFGGFQLLDLQDFPGQGTALVGILDSFMDSKGLIEPKKWREFCSETVILLKMKKYIWTNDEIFHAQIEVANYGPSDFLNAVVSCGVFCNEETVKIESFPDLAIKQGGISSIGEIQFALDCVKVPSKVTIEIKIEDTDYVNHYDIWVYQWSSFIEIPGGINICRRVDDDLINLLENGEKVLFLPELTESPNSIKGAFIPDFWCYSMFKKYNPVGTLGIVCSKDHCAFKKFPTESHSNWQWWNLVKNSRPLILDNVKNEFSFIVEAIDNIHRQHTLGIIFETNILKGRILVCSIELLNQLDRPEARQLLISIMSYMDSDSFKPVNEMEMSSLIEILSTDRVIKDNVKGNKDADIFG